jgi:hypothetical protein
MIDKKYMFDDFGKAYEIPVPRGWTIDIKPLGVEVWAHAPDGESGVSEIAPNTRQALEGLKKRMEDWLK